MVRFGDKTLVRRSLHTKWTCPCDTCGTDHEPWGLLENLHPQLPHITMSHGIGHSGSLCREELVYTKNKLIKYSSGISTLTVNVDG